MNVNKLENFIQPQKLELLLFHIFSIIKGLDHPEIQEFTLHLKF